MERELKYSDFFKQEPLLPILCCNECTSCPSAWWLATVTTQAHASRKTSIVPPRPETIMQHILLEYRGRSGAVGRGGGGGGGGPGGRDPLCQTIIVYTVIKNMVCS